MSTHNFFKRRSVYLSLSALTATVILTFGLISVRLAIARHRYPDPQIFLVLGGSQDRERFTAQLAQAYPSLDIWVSSRQPPEQIYTAFTQEYIPKTRVLIDSRAADTVTNFTSLVQDLKTQNIRHIYLITSDYHMPRSEAIAFVVLGSYGIAYTPVSVPSAQPQEPWFKTVRDVGRSVLWVVTGRTGRRFALSSKPMTPPLKPSES